MSDKALLHTIIIYTCTYIHVIIEMYALNVSIYRIRSVENLFLMYVATLTFSRVKSVLQIRYESAHLWINIQTRTLRVCIFICGVQKLHNYYAVMISWLAVEWVKVEGKRNLLLRFKFRHSHLPQVDLIINIIAQQIHNKLI